MMPIPVPARHADFAEKRADPLSAGYFGLNGIFDARNAGPP
jgi:hypothetical protein